MKTLQDISVSIVEMTPAEISDKGRGLDIGYAFASSPFGEVLLAATARGICCLFFADDRVESVTEMKKMFPEANFTERMMQVMSDAMAVLEEPRACSTPVPLHLKGTSFQMEVWRALLEIPWGETRRYSEIAARVGRPKACRATGSAVGANPVSVLVPCHRVLPGAGGVGQYRWGTNRKKSILENEQSSRTV